MEFWCALHCGSQSSSHCIGGHLLSLLLAIVKYWSHFISIHFTFLLFSSRASIGFRQRSRRLLREFAPSASS